MTQSLIGCVIVPQSLVGTGTWLLGFAWTGSRGCRTFARKATRNEAKKLTTIPQDDCYQVACYGRKVQLDTWGQRISAPV